MKSLNEKKVLLAEYSQLKTKRLLLTPLSLLHLSDYHEYISDDETLKFEFFPTKTIQESKESLVNWNIANPLGVRIDFKEEL